MVNMRLIRAIVVTLILCAGFQGSAVAAPSNDKNFPFWRMLRLTAQESCDRYAILNSLKLPLQAGSIYVGLAEDSYVVECTASDGKSGSKVYFTFTVEPCSPNAK